MAWLQENMTLILAVLLGLSEVLALIPAIKSNSIFTFIYNAIKALVPKKELPKP